MNKNISFVSCYEPLLNVENVEMKLILGDNTLSPENKFGREMHSHFYTEVVVCNGEDAEITFEDKATVIHNGEIALYPEKTLHVIKNSDYKTHCFGIDFKRLNIKSNVDVYNSLIKLLKIEECTVFRIGRDKCGEITAMTKNDSVTIQSLLSVFKFLLSLSDMVNKTRDDFVRNSLANYSVKLVREVEQVIFKHYTKRMSNEDIASILNISSRQLYDIVKKRYGTSVQQLFIQRRLEEAKKLLSTGRLKIPQICEQIGWSSNITSFFRAFKNKYGVSPSEYRELFNER